MATEKRKLEMAVRSTAEIIEEHLGTLPPTEAKAILKTSTNSPSSLPAPRAHDRTA
jgi:hypothetical protein